MHITIETHRTDSAPPAVPDPHEGRVARLAALLTTWSERWIPDAFVFALIGTVIVCVAALVATPASPGAIIDAWGNGFWELIPFTLQMALVIITGYVLATSGPMQRGINWLATWPTTPKGAVAFVTFVALTTSWFNWGFSLIFSAVLAREVARRTPSADYRALAAASFLGIGSIWAQGLSGSAALQMASPGALPPQIRAIVAQGGIVPDGLISFAHTIFLWQSLASVLLEIVVVTGVMWLAAPTTRARNARDLGIDLGTSEIDRSSASAHATTPGAWFEHSPVLSWIVVALGFTYVVRYFGRSPDPLSAITLNILNLTFLLLGFLLHRTPARLVVAVQKATPAVWGVILQFPFYAGIAAVIVGTGLNERMAAAFVQFSTPATFPAVVGAYSAVLGVFVPSGGSKWVIEAPYVMAAAHSLQVHLGWVVASYDLGEALANLIQPFWMLPILGLFNLRARDVMGYTFVVFLVLTPLVLTMLILFGLTLSYPL